MFLPTFDFTERHYDLSLDFSLGAGYIGGNYTKYTYQDGEYEWLADMKRQYFGLTKAEVSLVYHLELGGKGGR